MFVRKEFTGKKLPGKEWDEKTILKKILFENRKQVDLLVAIRDILKEKETADEFVYDDTL